ncbi:MAG: hypothetical protein M3Y72_04390 [Acidobacteriota bacterium]|nr:hypothetical protein [Acidobacteriota bacterium]
MSEWKRLPLEFTVVNFFTQSAYAPQAMPSGALSVTEIRRREDHKVLLGVNNSIGITDHQFVDAPVRLGIALAAVCDPQTGFMLTEEVILQLAASMHSGGNRLAIAPLGLGGHIDHLAVRAAATRKMTGRRLAFYEDLPYATWSSESQVRERVSEAEEATRVRLKPLIVRGSSSAANKRRVVSKYRSQITSAEATALSAWSDRFGGGERIWMPRHSSHWNFV